MVYRDYGIAHHASGEYEVDHLISLELGGSNDIRNLWPESYRTEPWNAHVKDKLENKLHELVCAGKVSLPEVQKAIATTGSRLANGGLEIEQFDEADRQTAALAWRRNLSWATT